MATVMWTMPTVLSFQLLESLEVPGNAANMLADQCVVGITVNVEWCAEEMDRCLEVATALNP